MRGGYSALRAIADFFSIPYDPDPQQTDRTSIAREKHGGCGPYFWEYPYAGTCRGFSTGSPCSRVATQNT